MKQKNANITGLQLADLISLPSRNDILSDYHLKISKKKVFGDKIIEIIKNKYYSKNDKILGYGKKILP